MKKPVSDLDVLLASLEPVLNPVQVAYVFIAQGQRCPFDLLRDEVLGMFREAEGLTVIVELDLAVKSGLPIEMRAAWITLTVHSDLKAVGLTAAFAGALGAAGISCNVVAATFHDHIFVAQEDASQAMSALEKLQRNPVPHA